MPRQPRLDAPGAIHHIWARGVGRQTLFAGDGDRTDFVARLERILCEAGVTALSWALMPNHVHLVLQGGEAGISKPMHRVLGGYAGAFNRRHGRDGHLFQNRFGSRIAVDDADLMGLVRYVCLNPVRAGIVGGLRPLEHHPWTSYSALMGRRPRARFESIDAALALFAPSTAEARRQLAGFMREGLRAEGEAPAPTGRPGVALVAAAVSAHARLAPNAVASGSRTPAVSRARALIAFVAVDRLGIRPRDVARELGVSESAVSHSRRRGRTLLDENTADSLTKLVKFQVRPRDET